MLFSVPSNSWSPVISSQYVFPCAHTCAHTVTCTLTATMTCSTRWRRTVLIRLVVLSSFVMFVVCDCSCTQSILKLRRLMLLSKHGASSNDKLCARCEAIVGLTCGSLLYAYWSVAPGPARTWSHIGQRKRHTLCLKRIIHGRDDLGLVREDYD